MKVSGLADFLEQKNTVLSKVPAVFFEKIKEICKLKPNQECCGIIYEKDNNLFVLECDNLSRDVENSFVVDSSYFIEYDVRYVYHSHCKGSCSPSVCDMKSSDELCIPFLIYSLRDDNFYLYQNVGV